MLSRSDGSLKVWNGLGLWSELVRQAEHG
jgi:hypothetical protein